MPLQPNDPVFQGRCTQVREREKQCISTTSLRNLARQLRIPGRSRLNKSQLVHAICNVSGMTKERLFSTGGVTAGETFSRSPQRSRRNPVSRPATSPGRTVRPLLSAQSHGSSRGAPSQQAMRRSNAESRPSFMSPMRPVRRPPTHRIASPPPSPPSRTRTTTPSPARPGPSTRESSRGIMALLRNFFRGKFPFRKRPRNWYRRVPNQSLPSTMNENNRMDPVSFDPMNRGIKLACGHWFTKDTFERVARGMEYDGELQTPRCPMCRRVIRARDFGF